jgi:2-amino-4-hydroxy-6-hydroxymethyldihydropteridine diphosphokinase/dihydropteroate synthase
MIYISLGSNLGNRLSNLQAAIYHINQSGFKICKQSIIIETAALLPENAPDSWNLSYLNMMIAGETILEPETLLVKLQQIELQLGRPKNHAKWSPRIIDLDIVLWDDASIYTPNLTIPHPELIRRNFWQYLLNNLKHPHYRHCNPLDIISSKIIAPKLMGIVNVTQDSFSDGGLYFSSDAAYQHALKLHSEGASGLDIGAQSTRPGAVMLSGKEEIAALEPILTKIISDPNMQNVKLSIDTFRPEVALTLAKKYPLTWINDVSGKLDNETLKTLQKLGCGLCIMHSLSVPADPKKVFA